MSDIELALRCSKQIESLLVQKFGAVGKGLHEKITHVVAKLPPGYMSEDCVKKIRFIATIRNKVVHEEGSFIQDKQAFSMYGSEVMAYLEALPVPQQAPGFFKKCSEKMVAKAARWEVKTSEWVLSHGKKGILGAGFMSFGLGWYHVGVGAGVVASLVGMFVGLFIFSPWFVERMFTAGHVLVKAVFYVTVGILSLYALNLVFFALYWSWDFAKLGG